VELPFSCPIARPPDRAYSKPDHQATALDSQLVPADNDASWAKYLDKGLKGTYADEPGQTTQLIYRRLA
jgi:hypothetical protein